MSVDDFALLSHSVHLSHCRQLSRSAQSIAQSLHEASLKSSTQNRRQVHSNVQDKINDSLVDIRLYEKGLKVWESIPVLEHEILFLFFSALPCSLATSAGEIFAKIAGERRVQRDFRLCGKRVQS